MSDLLERFADRDVRALARLITMVEQDRPEAADLLADLRARLGPQPRRVGLTGAPGAGKSTLLSALITAARSRAQTVGVLAVDPSSPFSGGALLGDRLRMDEHVLDPGVFVRSTGARGQLGGLSPHAVDVAWLIGAFGFDEVLVETVGTGQSELELMTLVDTTVVVLTPAAGDSVQLEKAGIVEIADVFVVNKADLPGAERMVHDVHAMLRLGGRRNWMPPVVATVAHDPDHAPALDELWAAVHAHRAYLDTDPGGRAADAGKLTAAAAGMVAARARAWAVEQLRADPSLVSADDQHLPTVVADRLLALLPFDRAAPSPLTTRLCTAQSEHRSERNQT